jgi:hypothetical protein
MRHLVSRIKYFLRDKAASWSAGRELMDAKTRKDQELTRRRRAHVVTRSAQRSTGLDLFPLGVQGTKGLPREWGWTILDHPSARTPTVGDVRRFNITLSTSQEGLVAALGKYPSRVTVLVLDAPVRPIQRG